MINTETQVGQEFIGPRRTISMPRMLAFSGGPIASADWPARNLHTDGGKAKEAGLAAPIASGIQYEGYVIELLLELFGDGWFERGKLQVKYPRPVMAGETVTAKARVASRESRDGGIAFELEIWCEHDDANKVLVGTASCVLPAG